MQGLGWTDRAIVCPSDLSFDTARHRYIIVCHGRRGAAIPGSWRLRWCLSGLARGVVQAWPKSAIEVSEL